MTNTMTTLGIMAFALGVLGVGTVTYAYQGDPSVQGSNYSAERHEAMTRAFADGDYAAWKELMAGKGRVTQVINEDNFPVFVRAHERAQAGDLEQARDMKRELGLGQGQQRRGGGNGAGVGAGEGGQRSAPGQGRMMNR